MSIADVLLTVARLSTRDAAPHFATAGLPVFPCEPGGKRPLSHAGHLDATLDTDTVTRWWRRWPQANIGLPTGPRSGIDVVDVDVKGDRTGFEMFHRAVNAGLLDGEIARVRTPSGGMHVYFPATASPQRCWQAGRAHIDFRGEGGYVVVPPSVAVESSGVIAYRPFSISSGQAQPIDAGSLRAFLDPRSTTVAPESSTAPNAELLGHWVMRLREGERNHGLFWAACRLSEAGVRPDAIIEVLGPAASRIGLDEREIERTVRSAWRHAGQTRGGSIEPFNSRTPTTSYRDPRTMS